MLYLIVTLNFNVLYNLRISSCSVIPGSMEVLDEMDSEEVSKVQQERTPQSFY